MNIRKTVGTIILTIISILYVSIAFSDEQSAEKTSMFNEQWLDTVVSIEQLQPEHKPDGTVILNSDGRVKVTPKAIGTGFLVETTNKHLILITARHVVADATNSIMRVRDSLAYRINQQEGPAYLLEDLQLEKNGRGKWFLSTTHDVACRFMEVKTTSKLKYIPQEKFLLKKQLQTAANLLVLGFPLGLRSEEHPNPIARKGMVARSDKDDLLADAFVFPGNSGGPVLYEPPIKIKGNGLITSPFINEERLIGLVSAFLPYTDIAISQQTKRPRVVFEENSGLASIVPIDAISDLLNREDVAKLDSFVESK